MKTASPPKEDAPRQPGCLARWLVYTSVLTAASLTIAFGVVAFAFLNFNVRYAGLIYPGVGVYGIDLSGLNVDQATDALANGLPDPDTTPLTLRSGDLRLACQWSDLGLHYDPRATAQMAFDVGRHGTPEGQYETQLRALVVGHMLSPVILLPDPAFAATVLEEMAPELLVPPVNAGLVIEPDGVSTTPAQLGREMAVDETVEVLAPRLRIRFGGPKPRVADPAHRARHSQSRPGRGHCRSHVGRAVRAHGQRRLVRIQPGLADPAGGDRRMAWHNGGRQQRGRETGADPRRRGAPQVNCASQQRADG